MFISVTITSAERGIGNNLSNPLFSEMIFWMYGLIVALLGTL